ncbi:hypothetical protein [Pseudactinotalea suaedae]|jgi:hypothetical protein|uniref:hypothetical protein n=1 Tax=Pseudactinotalea suaedae TaxID=1524924 RepID=UPI0012E111B9|nr:hypothetical protein [Pseudactinotalea suaedae]
MTSITAHAIVRRPRTAAPARPTEVPVEDNHLPTNDVPGPDERTLARTTAAVVTSLVLLIGTMVVLALGVGTVANAVTEWFLSR